MHPSVRKMDGHNPGFETKGDRKQKSRYAEFGCQLVQLAPDWTKTVIPGGRGGGSVGQVRCRRINWNSYGSRWR